MKIAPNLEIGPGAVTDTFAAIVAAGGKPVARGLIAAGTGYPEKGSSMKNALSTLRSREIIVDHADGAISAAPELFDARA